MSRVDSHPAVGVGYRRVVAGVLRDRAADIDVLEVLIEHFLPLTGARRRELEALVARGPVVLHGVGMSPASVTPPPEEYWRGVAELVRLTGASFVGEHASLSKGGGVDLWHLSPLWRTEEQLAVLAANVAAAQERLGVPLAIETITEGFELGPADYPWDEFLAELARRTGCGLVLDVTNLAVNRANGHPEYQGALYDGIAGVPWWEIHAVGYSVDDRGRHHDSHNQPVGEVVLDELRTALTHRRPACVIVERDARFEAYDEVFDDLVAIRRVTGSLR